ncbi:MAG TPA: methyl-accepting chemotaxis protein [Dissulfurispiraceae bacterium]
MRIIEYFLAIGLKKKVLIGYLFMSVVIFTILAVIAMNIMDIKAKYDSLSDMSNDIQILNQLKASIDATRAAFLLMTVSKSPEVRQEQEKIIATHLEKIDKNLEKIKKGRYRSKGEEIERIFLPFRETLLKEIVPLIKEGKVDAMMDVLGRVQAPRANVFLKLTDEVIESSRKDFSEGIAYINHEIRMMALKVVAFIMVIFSIAFVFSFWFINRYIVGVLQNISSSAEQVAGGDLTIKVAAMTGDEFGGLADDVNKIIHTMQSVLRDIANKTVYILKDATNLTLYGKDVSKRVDKDLERTTTAAAATEEMSSTIGDVARNISIASEASGQAREISAHGKKTVDETVSSIKEVNAQILSASEKVKTLAELSMKIDETVIMIKDIADQTNLLALNAAIEAARAGEQGRGFAVVADEVRKLAQRTTTATADINNVLSAIHKGTVDATDMMDIAVEKAKSTNAFAHRLDQAFREIQESFEKVSDMVHQVVTATEEQSATATEISGNLSTIAEDAKESTVTVKNMALSFNKFSANAKEFLKLLDGFNDPKMKVGILKSDYVLWLHRLLDAVGSTEASIAPEELYADKSRMGRWYLGEGKQAFGDLPAFRELEAPHRQLHELGTEAYEASRSGEHERAARCLAEAVGLIDRIVALLDRLETEA